MNAEHSNAVRVWRLDRAIDPQPDEVSVYAAREYTGRHLMLTIEPVEYPADRFALIASRWETLRLALSFARAALFPPPHEKLETSEPGEVPF